MSNLRYTVHYMGGTMHTHSTMLGAVNGCAIDYENHGMPLEHMLIKDKATNTEFSIERDTCLPAYVISQV